MDRQALAERFARLPREKQRVFLQALRQQGMDFARFGHEFRLVFEQRENADFDRSYPRVETQPKAAGWRVTPARSWVPPGARHPARNSASAISSARAVGTTPPGLWK